MKKEELWSIYCEKNTQFRLPEVRVSITVTGIRKMFDQTYDAAHRQGVRDGEALAAMRQPPKSEFDKLFGGLF